MARQRAERQAARRVEERARRRRIALGGGAAAVVIAIVAVVVVAITNGHHSKVAALKTSPSPTPSASSTAAASYGGTPICHYKASAAPKVKGERSFGLPPDHKATGHPVATIDTNRGVITISLDATGAPCTVNSFEFLAKKGYFTHTPCHRLTDYAADTSAKSLGLRVLQCGDPTGTGEGGPGYVFPSENLTGATYPTGTVAMANSGSSDTNGSQFFLVWGPTTLPADYTPFGTITAGLPVLQAIAAHGEVATSSTSNGKIVKEPDGKPKESVIIESVTVRA
jgi:peptidyl-prolyl cis-trans isomerase B (cyclophilin B)